MKQTVNIFLAFFLFGLVSCSEEETKYDLVEVTQENLIKKVETHGSIESYNVVDVYAPVSGRLEQLLIKEGDMVFAKQKIATMSSESRSQTIDMAASKGPEEVAYWKKQMLLTPIYAPVSGKVIILKAFNTGERVSGSVAQISTGEVIRANLDEADLSEVKLGQKPEIYFDIDSKAKLVGELVKISQTSKQVNNVNTYQIEVSLPDENDKQRKKLSFEIKIGMSVTLFFSVNEKKNTPVLPSYAVNGKAMTSVKVIMEDGSRKKIKLGDTYDNWVEVISGLEPGQKILVPAVKIQKKNERKSPLMLQKK